MNAVIFARKVRVVYVMKGHDAVKKLGKWLFVDGSRSSIPRALRSWKSVLISIERSRNPGPRMCVNSSEYR